MPESRLTTEMFATPDLAMRWIDGSIVHEGVKYWDDEWPEVKLRCGRTPWATPLIGPYDSLPKVTCLLCIEKALEDEHDEASGLPW